MKNYFWTFLPAVLILGGLIAGFFIFRAGIKREMLQELPSPSPLLTETPESTPAAKVKRESLKLQVLNGRGVAGSAGEAKTYLEDLGYKDIKTGNADSFDYEETEISVKKDKEDYFGLLKEDLSKNYVLSGNAKILDPESKFDAVIIIGEK